MKTEKAKCISNKQLLNGITSLGFTFRGEYEDFSDEDTKDNKCIDFNLVTGHQDLEVLWSIEAENLSEYVKWKKVKLVKSNKSFYGNFVIKGSCNNDYDCVAGNFDTASLPFEQSFEITNENLCDHPRITIFIYVSTKETVNASIVDDYERLLEDREFSDLIFVVNKEEIPAHKQILTARNEVFAKMIEFEMLKKSESRIEISDIEPEIFKLLLKFIYCGKFEIKDTEIILKVMMAADKYSVNGLFQICEEYLLYELSVDNVMFVLDIADLLDIELLKTKCINLIIEEKDKVVLTDGYKEVVKAARADLLSEIFCRMEVVKPVVKDSSSDTSTDSAEECFDESDSHMK